MVGADFRVHAWTGGMPGRVRREHLVLRVPRPLQKALLPGFEERVGINLVIPQCKKLLALDLDTNQVS